MKKFSIIIIHYNQMQYIEESLLSVFKQDYKNIELILADDGSKQFNRKKVERIINKNNRYSYECKILDKNKNVGTVKNVNNAMKYVTGDYVLIFAADDKLYNEKVVSNFVKGFEDETKNIITAQCIFYGKDFTKKQRKFVNPIKAFFINKKSSLKMYKKMAEKCFYASGSTAYRKEVFKKYGLFDEKYAYVEDLPYWLKILREGEKIHYINFNALCHRDGGISHSEYTVETLPAHVKSYYHNLVDIYKDQIFPYLDKFNIFEKYRVLAQYQQTTNYFAKFSPDLLYELTYVENEKRKDKIFNIYWKFRKIFNNFNVYVIDRIKILFKYNIAVPINFIVWFFEMLFIVNNIKFEKNIMLIIYIASYFASFAVVNFIVNIIKSIKSYRSGGLNV